MIIIVKVNYFHLKLIQTLEIKYLYKIIQKSYYDDIL